MSNDSFMTSAEPSKEGKLMQKVKSFFLSVRVDWARSVECASLKISYRKPIYNQHVRDSSAFLRPIANSFAAGRANIHAINWFTCANKIIYFGHSARHFSFAPERDQREKIQSHSFFGPLGQRIKTAIKRKHSTIYVHSERERRRAAEKRELTNGKSLSNAFTKARRKVYRSWWWCLLVAKCESKM